MKTFKQHFSEAMNHDHPFDKTYQSAFATKHDELKVRDMHKGLPKNRKEVDAACDKCMDHAYKTVESKHGPDAVNKLKNWHQSQSQISEDFKAGDKITYQMNKKDRGNGEIHSASSAKKNHYYIKTEKEGTILVPHSELMKEGTNPKAAARNAAPDTNPYPDKSEESKHWSDGH